MKWIRFVVLAAVLLTATRLFGQSFVSLRAQPTVIIPIASTTPDGTDRFSVGGGLSLQGEFTMPFAHWLFAEAVIDSSILPLNSANLSMQTAGIGAGVGAQFSPASRLVLKASVYGGGEVALLGALSAFVPFVAGVADVEFQLSPSFTMGLGGSYRATFAGGGVFYQGVGVALNFAYRLGASKKGAAIEVQPSVAPVYPLYYTYYDENPAGNVVVRNDERDPLKDVQVSFYVPQFMDRPKPSGTEIDSLKSGAEMEIPLYALFSNDIFGITEGLKVSGEVLVEYTWLGKEFTSSIPVTVDILNRNAMTWSDDRKAAAFVTANNPLVKSYAKSLASNIRSHDQKVFDDTFRIAMGIFEALTLHGVGYVIDPASAYEDFSENAEAVDYIQFPGETLAYQAGDCDDIAVLYSALLEAAGIKTAFITAPGHIYMAFDMGIEPDRARKIFSQEGDLIFRDGTTWVPVEVTLTEQGFLEAWRVGAREWRETVDAGTNGFYPVHEAWKIYKPVENPTGEVVFLPAPDEVIVAYGKALDRLIYRDVEPLVSSIREDIRKGGGNAKLYNRMGVVYAKYGLLDDAEPWFERAVDEREYPSALVNLGNVAYLKGRFDEAARFYNRALKVDDDNSRALLGLAKASYQIEEYGQADEAMILLATSSPAMAERYSYLGTTTDASVSRASSAATDEVYGWDDEE